MDHPYGIILLLKTHRYKMDHPYGILTLRV